MNMLDLSTRETTIAGGVSNAEYGWKNYSVWLVSSIEIYTSANVPGHITER